MRFQGKVFRAINAVWAHDPLSGRGAAITGGRFNPKGVECYYTSLHYEIAIREAVQGIGDLEPTMIIACQADVTDLVDLSTADKITDFGVDIALLRSPNWRDEMDDFGKSQSQELAERLIADGHAGMLVPSFAPNAASGDTNLVLWKWGDDLPHMVRVIDTEDRLGRMQPRKPPASAR